MNSDKPPKSSLGGSVRRQLKADAESNKAVGEFKVPDSNLLVKRPKRKKVKVLDEEDYADKVSAIIQRDFFPGTSSFNFYPFFIQVRRAWEKMYYSDWKNLHEFL